MTFPVLTIRSGDQEDDDRLFPDLAAPTSGRVTALSPLDGKPAPFVATGVTVTRIVEGTHHKVLALSDVRIDVDVTDCRVVLGCQKYDKGGGWTGFGAGAVFALAANGVSKAMAANRRRGKVLVGHVRYAWLGKVGGSPKQGRRRGKVLVGHVRYAWLGKVGGSPKQGWLDTEQLRLIVHETAQDGGAMVMLTLSLPKSMNSLAISQDVVRRAATWRLSNDLSVDQEERLSLEQLQHAQPLSAQPKSFSLYTMPTSFRVSAGTAVGPVGQAPGAQGREVLDVSPGGGTGEPEERITS